MTERDTEKTVRVLYDNWDSFSRMVVIEYRADDGHGREVVVRQRPAARLGGKHNPQSPVVSVRSYGSCSLAETFALIAALVTAAEVVVEMGAVKEWQRITPPKPGLVWCGDGMPELHIADGRAWVSEDGWEPRKDGDDG